MKSVTLEIKKKTRVCEQSLESSGNVAVKKLLCFVFTGSRGGIRRIQIILQLKQKSLNRHQLSKSLEIEYKSVQQHIKILKKYDLITESEERYGKKYFISSLLESNIMIFDEIAQKMEHYFIPNEN